MSLVNYQIKIKYLLQAQAHQPWVTKSPVHLNLDMHPQIFRPSTGTVGNAAHLVSAASLLNDF